MTQYPLKEYCGQISCADIGIRQEYTENFDYIIRRANSFELKYIIPPKKSDSHKGNYGRLLIVCGSEKMPGACIMAAEAAARSGVGLLQIATVKGITPVIASRIPEAMLEPLESDENGFISVNNYDKIMNAAEKSYSRTYWLRFGSNRRYQGIGKKAASKFKLSDNFRRRRNKLHIRQHRYY